MYVYILALYTIVFCGYILVTRIVMLNPNFYCGL